VHHYELTVFADDEARWRVFIRRAEALYALTSLLVDAQNAGGLAGSEWAAGYLKNHQKGRINLRDYTDRPDEAGQYLAARRGNFGQFYVRSMTDVGLLQPSVSIPVVSRPRGKEMAESFAASAGARVVKLIADTLSRGRLEFEEAKIIGEALNPAAIDEHSTEMRHLRDFLLANVPDTMDGTARRSTAWLLLDLLRKGVSLDDQNAIRRAFYHRLLPNDERYERTGEIIDRWRIYQANELCHVALEVWLNAIVLKLETYPAGATPAGVITDLLSETFESGKLKGTFRDWINGIPTDAAHEEQAAQTVMRSLWDRNKTIDHPVLRAAGTLLAILWSRWSDGDGGVREQLRIYAGDGASLANALSSFDAKADDGLQEALASVLQEHIVDTHLTIAARKLAATGKFTYRFMLSDGVLTEGRHTDYDFTNPRLGNLVRFLFDAKLCRGGKLTAAGRKFLDENQPA
jgi:hypothetical protein